MSWIQENKFAAMLGGATLLGAIVIGYFGMSYRSKYSQALQQYTEAAEQVEEFENLRLYPSDDNAAAKKNALNTYRAEIIGLQGAFGKFRPKELPNVSPQAFTDQAKAADEEVVKAFGDKTKLPEGFFMGAEAYTATLARGEATGVLSFQLGAIKELLLSLAKAAPSELKNLYRPKSIEEDGGKWTPGATDTARAFPLEITFKGPEKSARAFLSALANSPNYYYTVRTLRITNEKNGQAPNKRDAKFDAPQPAGGAPGSAADPFGGFVLPEDPPAADPPPDAPATPPAVPATPAAPAPAPAAAADTSRILQPILGEEEVQVFLRIDLMQFLPVKELPTVPK